MNKYLIEGTRTQQGALVSDTFTEKIEAPSSRDAYLTVLNQPGFSRVQVVAIKMELNGSYHLEVDPNLYLK